jgi:predicted DNA-binding protein
MEDEPRSHHKVISLRLPAELLNRIDICAKNSHGISRTTWIIQALDHQIKGFALHVNDTKSIDKKITIPYDKSMKTISNSYLIKILLICALTSGVAGCVGASMASGASLWSFTSGFSDRSGTADKISAEEKAKLKKEIKEEIARDLLLDTAHPKIELRSTIS